MSGDPKRLARRVEVVRRSARLERIRARAPRQLFVVAATVLSVLGVRELVSPAQTGEPDSATARIDHATEDFAQRFARAYLAHDEARPAVRERALRELVSDDLSLDAGFVGRGSQEVLWTQIAQNQEAIAGGRVIVVAAGVSTQASPMYLAIPVFRGENGAIGLADYPSLVGPPTVSRAAFADRPQVEQPQIVAVVRRVVANYLGGEAQNLAADLAPDAEVSLPSRELVVRTVEDIAWADGIGSSAVLVTVTARDSSGSTATLTYELGIDQSGERPYVSFVETVPNAP